MSTPSYESFTKATLYKHGQRKMYVAFIFGMLFMSAFAIVYITIIDNDVTNNVAVGEESEGVCPESLGGINDAYDYTLFLFATCGDDLVITPGNNPNTIDMQVLAEQLVSMVGTGSAEAIGLRINIDMGKAPVETWISALKALTA